MSTIRLGSIAMMMMLLALSHRAGAEVNDPGEKRQVLSTHSTVSQLVSVKARQCMGRTALCPDRCGHSGDFAEFKVLAYLRYEKKGEYGDPKATTFVIQLNDNQGNLKVPKATADAIRTLNAGDFLRLDWQHEYVTRTEPGGGSSSFPERTVSKIDAITKEQADKAVADANKP